MDTNERFRGIEETLSDVLLEVQQLRQGQETMTKAFDRFGDAVLAKLSELTDEVKGMRQDMKQLQDHEERIRRIEDVMFRKGA
jgi:predicted  nucleic acid-binding Zn-ribbon protein